MLDRPKIISMTPHNDYTIDMVLSDGRKLKLHMQKFLNTPAYKKLLNLGFFLSAQYDFRTIYWDDMHDMHIDQILSFADPM